MRTACLAVGKRRLIGREKHQIQLSEFVFLDDLEAVLYGDGPVFRSPAPVMVPASWRIRRP